MTSDSIGPYRIECRLGQGGMGEVYKGYDDRLERPVALKRIRPGAEVNERTRQRFRREARSAARLHHPAIVQVHDWVESEGGNWIVMELVEGVSLRYMLASGALPPFQASRLVHNILEGLAVAHSAGIVHRDLKAENVMVSPGSSPGSSPGRGGEQAKILDFGLAKPIDPRSTDTQISIEGGVIGTLSAMSPEQVLGRKVDQRSDLFSLGSLVYEMVTGLAPFHGSTAGEILGRITTIKPQSACLLYPAVPENLSAWIDHLLEKDPRRRPATAQQALDSLEVIISTLSKEPSPHPPEASARNRPLNTRPLNTEPLNTKPLNTEPLNTEPLNTELSGDLTLEDRPRHAVQPTRQTGRRRLAASLLFMALLAVALVVWIQMPTAPRYIAVPPVRTSEASSIAGAAHAALLRGLSGRTGLTPVELSAEEATWQDPQVLARALAADEVLIARLQCPGDPCQIELRRLRGDDGRLIRETTVVTPPHRPLQAHRLVEDAVAELYPRYSVAEDRAELQVRGEDYDVFLRLVDNEKLSNDERWKALDRLSQTSPGFLDLALEQFSLLLQQFQELRISAVLDRAERTLAKAESLAPEDPRLHQAGAELARARGQQEDALTTLDRLLEAGYRPDSILTQKALLLTDLDRPEDARAWMQQVVAERPAARHLLHLADLYKADGEEQDSAAQQREYVEQALELAPESITARTRLASIELSSGDLNRAIKIYRALVDDPNSPRKSDDLVHLGQAFLLLGDYSQAAMRFQQAAQLTPSLPSANLYWAEATHLLGQEDTAKALFEHVAELSGQAPRPKSAARMLARALAHLDRVADAVAAIQEDLRYGPDDPDVAYEAALVYSLVGDEASALWNMRRALDLGVSHRWFSLPWFDALREQIEEL